MGDCLIEELRIVHQAPSLPLHLQCKISWIVDCASIFIVNHRRASWMLVRRESKCGDLHTPDSIVEEDPVLSVMWMIFRWRIKNLLLFLVWWFKLFLIPGIHQRGEDVSIENNSRENQSTPAVLCKDVADGEGITKSLCIMSCPFPP